MHDRRAFVDATPVPCDWLPDPDMRVHRGVLGHHQGLWTAGVEAFFKAIEKRVLRRFPLEEVLLIGLSMGGALAGEPQQPRTRARCPL
jgi:hypothetical protein